MLFIVFGATLDMGYETRKIFEEEGFSVIHKYNYVENDSPVSAGKYRESGEKTPPMICRL